MKYRSQNLYSRFYSGLYGIVGFLFSLSVAWGLMANYDFFYGVWHDVGGIKEGIKKYGPANRYKPGFADTTRQQRLELFHKITVAIHRSGDGLREIYYQSPTSSGKQQLLREPEVIHLQDVANLLNLLLWPVLFVSLLWPFMGYSYYRKSKTLPEISGQLYGLCALLVLVGLILVVFGPETVFNTLHIWIFPSDHPWFFYYQDSLMSTMMLAPVLFAWIAAAWVALAIVIFILLNIVVARACTHYLNRI